METFKANKSKIHNGILWYMINQKIYLVKEWL